jgi:hypothetical protein
MRKILRVLASFFFPSSPTIPYLAEQAISLAPPDDEISLAPTDDFDDHSTINNGNRCEITEVSTTYACNLDREDSTPSFFASLPYDPTTILRTDSESLAPPQFRIHPHPTWPNTSAVWKADPLIIDPAISLRLSFEEECHGAQFRIQPEFTTASFGVPVLVQGTSFIFKGHEDPRIRYVVEWCQWTDDKNAYLKVVGMNVAGLEYPYNDHAHPTFILVAPRHLSFVPCPPALVESAISPSVSLHTYLPWIRRSPMKGHDCVEKLEEGLANA